MKSKIKTYDIGLFLTKFVFLFFIFYFMNFDRSFNIDYGNYELNYNRDWNQFEFGFELISDIFKQFNLSFSSFWVFILVCELVLISILYRNNIAFILAFPNLMFLSQGLLGTQVRFGLAICLFLVIFSFCFKKRLFWLWGAVAILFHNAVIIFYLLALVSKHFFSPFGKLVKKSNAYKLIIFIVSAIAVSFIVDKILISAGYYYYVGTKYQEGRSLIAMVYMLFSLAVIGLLICFSISGEYSEYLYFSFLMLCSALIFSQFSVISGRINLVYTLIEPFVMYYFYVRFGKKISVFPLFVMYCVLCFSKLITLSLII
ncbi:EpsG family protein [Vibrio parahaemolyticus]|nr:EpsG family protein [Vibrio parahaemolyticus]